MKLTAFKKLPQRKNYILATNPVSQNHSFLTAYTARNPVS